MAATVGETPQRGTCKWFNSSKGYGFITTEQGEDVFVHQSSIHAMGFRSLAAQEPVEFLLCRDETGRNRAIQVTGPGGQYVKGDERPPRRDNFAGGGYDREYRGDDRRAAYNGGGGGGGRRDDYSEPRRERSDRGYSRAGDRQNYDGGAYGNTGGAAGQEQYSGGYGGYAAGGYSSGAGREHYGGSGGYESGRN